MNGDLRALVEGKERRYAENRTVRFQDVDAAGIVFYARFFDYFHDAYVGMLRGAGAPLEAALESGEWVAPLNRAEAEYLRPLRFGDEVEVVVAGVDVGETDYVVAYRVETPRGVVAVGRTRHVSVDPADFQRAPVPPRLREALLGK